ncbi:hypothetical protein Glove_92g2 [Diversispora epigaea]|uniref:Uncharacterized protein n=1 Tax=Diversispora epigaea TaxID=1348612 RepID=A0A397JFQ4_9GLOM|nr:hypothetical protein Glove_92g2 [Diversispora epigaea]
MTQILELIRKNESNINDFDNFDNEIEVKKSSEKEDKLLQYLLDTYNAYLEKCERNDSSDKDVAIKQLHEKESNTSEPKPTIKSEVLLKRKSKKKKVIKIVKDNKRKKKENTIRSPFLRKRILTLWNNYKINLLVYLGLML